VSAALLLLALLSLATLASRQGGFTALLASTLPACVAGLVAGPRALGYLSGPLLTGLSLSTAVGVCWLGVLLGLRLRQHPPQVTSLLPATALVGVVAAVSALFGAGVLSMWRATPASGVAIACGLLVAATLVPFSTSSQDAIRRASTVDALALAAVCGAVLLLFDRSTATTTFVLWGLALAVGMSAVLIGGDDDVRRFSAVLAATALCTALASALDVHLGVVGSGLGLGIVARARRTAFEAMLLATAQPVRLVVAFLVAAGLAVDARAAAIGVVVGLGVAGIVVVVALARRRSLRELASSTATSSTGLLVLGGLALLHAPLPEPTVAALGIGFIVVDVVAVGAALWSRRTERDAA
jgi:hypothetical protein